MSRKLNSANTKKKKAVSKLPKQTNKAVKTRKKVASPKKALESTEQDLLGAENKERIRVLVAKAGLDGHDRGAKIVARALRDSGFEVIYTGLHQTPEMIVRSAIQEDVHCLGLSILSGAHMTLFPKILKLLKANKAGDIVVFGGGIIPAEDISKLKALGVKEIFPPGSSVLSIVDWLKTNIGSHRGTPKAK